MKMKGVYPAYVTLTSSFAVVRTDVSLFDGDVPRGKLEESDVSSATYRGGVSFSDGAVTVYFDGFSASYDTNSGRLSISHGYETSVSRGEMNVFKLQTPYGELDAAVRGVETGLDVSDAAVTLTAEYFSEIKGTDVQSAKIKIEAKFDEGGGEDD